MSRDEQTRREPPHPHEADTDAKHDAESTVARPSQVTPDEQRYAHLFASFRHLLTIATHDTVHALERAVVFVRETLHAEKVDVFLADADQNQLVAAGVSDTSLSARQHALGLDHLDLAAGGRAAEVYRSGRPYLSGHVEQVKASCWRPVRSLGCVPA